MDTIIKILLIDKEHSEYLLVGHLLAQVHHTDYQLTWANSLDGVQDQILSDDFDVILLDYHWGETNCLDLLNGARSQGCKVPIIVMTHEMEVEVDREAIRHGASDYLIKGHIEYQLLERTIRYAIERKAAEYKLAKLAHYDHLTNVPNRILFRDRLEHAIQLAARDDLSFTLMYLDLDGFKQVNDSFGHDAGDELIQACAERLRACMRKSDSVARIGGDEFTILLEHIDSTADIAHIAEKVLEVISRPYQIGSHQVVIGCSIGIAVYPDAGIDVDNLQKNADMAMYRAKLVEGSAYRFFTDAMNVEARRQLLLESELRRALRRDEFCLHYQPRVDIVTGEILGVEALLRWSHPERGLVCPAEFMAVAEDTGLIVPLGYWAIHRACQDLKRMQLAGLPPIVMAINLSLRQFNDDKLVERIATIAQETGVNVRQLEFEITETAIMENMDLVALCMRALSQLGCRFALDDFGTGYSSFLHLQRLPISTIKIDKGFVADIPRKREDATLVKAMVDLAHSLGKEVIAEGVETSEQLALLRDFGCDQTQGFYFCKPLNFEGVSKRLEGEPVLAN
jgi:diguanylate cyclase (GGDEF)-like protein